MEPRSRTRLLKWSLLGLLLGGAFYAMVLYPGPDLRPQVETFLRLSDADRLSEALASTGLVETWGLQELQEATRYRRGALGRFQEIESAEPLERLHGAPTPRRLLRVRLRFAKFAQPVSSTFTFTRGTSGWVLSDLDIPLPSGEERLGLGERAQADAEALARRLASNEFQAAFEAFTRQARQATTIEAFEERLRGLLDGLGGITQVRCLSCEPQGTRQRAQVEVRYDSGLVRLIELELQPEYGRWKGVTVEVRTP